MNFTKKIFLGIFTISILTCSIIVISLYWFLKKDITLEFTRRYIAYGSIISSSLQHLEITADRINKNALMLLLKVEMANGIPSDGYLRKLAKKVGINAFYVIDKNGKFLRSSDIPVKMQSNSLFSYSNEYKSLLYKEVKSVSTPIIPSFPHDIPAKLMMIPNHNKNLILEAGIHLKYISDILKQIIGTDKNIQSIGLYSPNGYELGSISSSGAFKQGRRNIMHNLSVGTQIIDDSIIFSMKIPASIERCPECIQKKVSRNDKYFYFLRLKVSLVPLDMRLNALKFQIIISLGLIFILAAIISNILAKKLVSRVQKINMIAKEILSSSNLNLKVDIPGKPDEISHLAETFNKMTNALKLSQEALVESEKMHAIVKVAGELAHDIRSPLAVMEITLTALQSDIPSSQKLILSEAIQNVRDIANNLLARYRQTSENTNIESTPLTNLPQDDGNITRPILLSSIIELVLSQKRQEWSLYPCQLSSTIATSAIDQWIEAAPNNIKRVLSNLLNNAYEALQKNRTISVDLTKIDNSLCLKLTDTGRGIPVEKINEVMNGLSLKHEGQGLGLTSSKNYLANMGARLSLTSVESVGTEVTISFPIMTKPSWFPLVISIPQASAVIILDDDTSIHNLWRHRLGPYDVRCYHFLSSKEILEWRKDNLSLFNEAILLIDYELKNDSNNGLVLFEIFNPQSRGYLITSHHEEVFIQQQCKRLGVNLIAKSLMGMVAIQLV